MANRDSFIHFLGKKKRIHFSPDEVMEAEWGDCSQHPQKLGVTVSECSTVA